MLAFLLHSFSCVLAVVGDEPALEQIFGFVWDDFASNWEAFGSFLDAFGGIAPLWDPAGLILATLGHLVRICSHFCEHPYSQMDLCFGVFFVTFRNFCGRGEL